MAEQKFAGILSKQRLGIGRPVKEGEDPWECDVHKGEIVVEIPLNERSTTGHTPHNYRLYTEPNVTLYAQPTDVPPLYGAELDYLLAVRPPSVRYREYLSSENLKEKMELKVGDIVIFKWHITKDAPESYVNGKIRYLGKLREHDGIYFGIEILEEQYRGKGTTNGAPYFSCGINNAVFVAVNKIVKKSQVPPKQPTTRSTNSTAISQSAGSKTPVVSQPTHKHPQAGPASNTKSLQSKQANSDSKKETWSQWSKDKVTKMAQDVFSKDAPTATGVSSDKPQQFKSGDRVVLQSVNNTAIYGTVRWVGDVGIHGQSVPFVGIETDENINPDKEFPELHVKVTDNRGQDLFKVASNHSRIFVPEGLVVHVEQYIEQKKKEDEVKYRKHLADTYGLSLEEYRAQKELIDKANQKRDAEHNRKEPVFPDPPLETEEQGTAGDFEETIKLVSIGRPVGEDRVEEQRKALEKFEEQIFKTEKKILPRNGVRHDSPVLGSKTSNQSPMIQQRSTPVDVHGPWHSTISHQHYSSNVPPPINEDHFTIGSMVVIPTQYGEPLRGVIMWIGIVPGKPGLIAGIELDQPYPGFTDGTYDGRRYFNCPSGRGYFCPLSSVQRDTTYTDVGQTIALSNDTQLLKEQLTQYQNKEAQLQQENKQIQVSVKSLEVEIATISKEKISLQMDQQEMMAKNKMLEREKQQLENDKQQLEIRQHQLEEQHQSVCNQLEKEKDEIESELQGQIARLSIENMRLNERVKELKQQKVTAMDESWKVNYKEVTLTKQELGRGGWGVVWIGEFRGQKVAVKQMHQSIVSAHFLQLLNREINIMAQLRHPNLLQFIGAVLDHPSGNPMIITEIMDISLRGAYEKKQLSPVPVSICLSIMRDVAVGLNYLHCLPDPIIHRDVSSANVLLESKGPGKWKTKISDFGSAKFARSAVTKAAGAEVYSAPEALQAVIEFEEEKQTPKMDVYSYGILLCEVMTCQFPERQIFRGMLQQVHTQSQPLYELVASCIKKDPQDRPTMKQVIQQLDKLPH